MKIEPLSTYRPREFALLTPGPRSLYVETKWGKQLFKGTRDVDNALRKLSDFTCYVASGLERLKHTTPATSWVMSTWRGKGIRMTYGPTGTTVTSLRSTLDASDDPYRDLDAALAWLRSYGVAPASISSMAWKLFRSSLNDTVTLGVDPTLSEPSFFGGRQEITTPAVFKDMKALDLKAAYPYAMSRAPFALTLREVDPSTHLDPTVAGLAVATVRVPATLPYPPLPVRLSPHAISFQWGELNGTWTWVELDAARRLGCDVTTHKVYAPRTSDDLFSTWWDMAQTGRELPGAAAKLAKAIANSTWGQFAMRGNDRTEVMWADDKGNEPYESDLPARPMPHRWAIHVASEVTARVRTQTLLEALYGSGDAAHVDTDGVIIPLHATNPKNYGDAFGQWRVKEIMKVCEVRAPQLYRFQRRHEGSGHPWHYVAAGMNHDQAQRTFERSDATGVSFLSVLDTCLPPTNADDAVAIERLLREATERGVA